MYRGIERCAGHKRITEVTDDGKYTIRKQFPGGPPEFFYRSTITELGWESLKQFLKARPAFKKVDQ